MTKAVVMERSIQLKGTLALLSNDMTVLDESYQYVVYEMSDSDALVIKLMGANICTVPIEIWRRYTDNDFTSSIGAILMILQDLHT